MHASQAYPDGTVTFLFTDIEGSTVLWERDPEAMRRAVDRHLALIDEAVSAAGGVRFKTVGDAVQAAFHTAPDALGRQLRRNARCGPNPGRKRSRHRACAWPCTRERRTRSMGITWPRPSTGWRARSGLGTASKSWSPRRCAACWRAISPRMSRCVPWVRRSWVGCGTRRRSFRSSRRVCGKTFPRCAPSPTVRRTWRSCRPRSSTATTSCRCSCAC